MIETKKEIKPNKAQQECIENYEGRFLVLAGPGTGKTFTLINRIAHMIKNGVNPEKILCLTFSDAAANEMKTRLAKELNVLDTKVGVFTFHGFCYQIIQDYSEFFELPQDIKIINKATTLRLIKEIIEEINPQYYRSNKNDPYTVIKTVNRDIDEIQRYRLEKNDYFENIEKNPNYKPLIFEYLEKIETLKQKGKDISKVEKKIEDVKAKIEKAKELWQFYELYKQKMQEEKYIDFTDMISLVLDKFALNSTFLDKVANKYEYILVDEYQDTNKSQNEIIFQIVDALKSQNVFVVGDDDQIIFTFQGARLDTMEQFLKKYPDTKVICLKENMRSTQNILDVAYALAQIDDRRLEANIEFKNYNIDKKLIAKNENLFDKNISVRCNKYFDIAQEYQSIVDEIEGLVNSNDCPKDDEGGKKLSEIAILCRTNDELNTFAQKLKSRNIPFDVKNGKSIFEINSSIVLYYYLQMLVNPELNSDKIFKLLLMEPFKINPNDYLKLCEKVSFNKSFLTSIKEITDFCEPQKMNDFIQTFEYLSTYCANENLKDVILEIGAKTKIFDYYLNSEINRSENIEGLKKLVDEAVDYAQTNKKILLADFVEYLNISYSENLEILTNKPPVDINGVQLLTYHNSKGREFEYVYMPTLMHSKWEADRHTFKINVPVGLDEYKNEDELAAMKKSDRIKNMYVGMTRAKHCLRLSYVLNLNDKTAPLSELLAGVLSKTEKNDLSNYTNEQYSTDCINQLIKREYDYKRDFKALIDGYLNNRAYSPSAINTYLKCPRQYMYNNILKLPSKTTSADAMCYGSAVHKALEEAVLYAKNNGYYPTKEQLIKTFKDELNSLALSSIQKREVLLGRGEKALGEYYNHLLNSPINSIENVEYSLSSSIDDYKFYGIVDRIDKNSDGTYTIYDYKTGSAKGKTMVSFDGSKQDYYNQMALYKYFYEKENNVLVKETCFIFPEEPTKNLYLQLTSEDCENVLERFKGAIDDIRACKFEPSYNKDACQFCEYKDFCKIDIV